MFSAPLWLLGLLALAIPLLLHLWSRRPRQVIRVGTLRHVDLTADARSWSARLTDPLLLALRLALLITIVFALAGLRLPARRDGGTGWDLVLVDPALLDRPAGTVLPFLDSLIREHAPVRLLAPGLPKAQLGDKSQVASHESQVASDLWSALTEADAIVGAKGTIHVVAAPRMAALRGDRPKLRANVEWHSPAGTDLHQWTVNRWRAGDTTIALSAAGSGAGAAYRLTRDAGSCGGCAAWPTTHVMIATGDDSVSRKRLTIGLLAIAQEIGRPVAITSVADSADLLLTSLPLTDSAFTLGLPVVALAPGTVASSMLVDSIWARWPWPLTAGDRDDPRLASLSQALASHPLSPQPVRGDPEATRRGLLLLALLLFGIERWLATRPGRSEA